MLSKCPSAAEAERDIDYMIAECARHMAVASRVKDAQFVSVVNKFEARLMDMQAAGLNVNRKARDLTTGVVSESKRLAIIVNNKRALSYILKYPVTDSRSPLITCSYQWLFNGIT